MKIIENVTSNLQQTETKRYGDEIHVYLNETEGLDEETSAVTYNYDKVIIQNADRYIDLVQIAKKHFAKQYLSDTDYINDKYKEEVELFEIITKEDFLAKHIDIYTKRAVCREVL